MGDNNHWHTLDLKQDQLIALKEKKARIPQSCPWCGKPAQYPHRVRPEGRGLSEKVRWITLEALLCPDCHREQRKIEIGGWMIMVGAMLLYIIQSALFPALRLENVASIANGISILLLMCAFLLASRRWQVARSRVGITLKSSGTQGLALDARYENWLKEFEENTPDAYSSIAGE